MTATIKSTSTVYDVGSDFTIPDVSTVSGKVELTAERDRIDLHNAYYDTPGLDLLRTGIVLRHRRGPIDPGWQLELLRGPVRSEPSPNTADQSLPEGFRELIKVVQQGAPLRQVAALHITRDVQRLIARDGKVLAELSDDAVDAEGLPGGTADGHWREIDVKLGEAGDPDLLTAIDHQLVRAGAEPAKRFSKLGHLLDSRFYDAADPSTAGAVALAYLGAQRAEILRGDVALRAGVDAVHDIRVATRRLRSTIRVFANLFHAGPAAHLETELTWYAGLLGEVRDREVLRRRLSTEFRTLPAPEACARAAAAIEERLATEQREHRRELLAALDSKRYRALLTELDSWAAAGPLTPKAWGGFGSIKADVRAAERTAEKALRHAVASGADDPSVHRARKAAKRARYAVELAGPVLGKPARHKIVYYTTLQELLGEFQDALLSIAFLNTQAEKAPEDGLALGLVFALERQKAHDARAELLRVYQASAAT